MWRNCSAEHPTRNSTLLSCHPLPTSCSSFRAELKTSPSSVKSFPASNRNSQKLLEAKKGNLRRRSSVSRHPRASMAPEVHKEQESETETLLTSPNGSPLWLGFRLPLLPFLSPFTGGRLTHTYLVNCILSISIWATVSGKSSDWLLWIRWSALLQSPWPGVPSRGTNMAAGGLLSENEGVELEKVF